MTETVEVSKRTAEVAHRNLDKDVRAGSIILKDVKEARNELEEKLDQTQQSLEETHG